MRSRAWRASAVTVAAVATLSYGLASTVAHADEPAPTTDSTEATENPETTDGTVPTGEVDGAIVAVDVPPVPPTTVEVAVGEPPVPPTSVVVAVDDPPVPPVTMPDATPIVASHAVAPAVEEQQLPETGAAAARATAIVAGAAVSIGAALRALAQRP
jgi:hypothetical protein